MKSMEEARRLPLGYQWDRLDLEETYSFRFSGIAWPGKDQGFGVVIGILEKRRRSGPPWREYHVLDECESWNSKELLLKCWDLHWRYSPTGWVTNRADAAGDAFTQDLYRDNRATYDFHYSPALFVSQHPGASPYSYLISGIIGELLGGSEKRLYLKHDKAAQQLGAIRKDEIPLLLPGTYPAIEAVGFALTDARDNYNSIPRSWNDDNDYDDDIDEGIDEIMWGFQPGN